MNKKKCWSRCRSWHFFFLSPNEWKYNKSVTIFSKIHSLALMVMLVCVARMYFVHSVHSSFVLPRILTFSLRLMRAFNSVVFLFYSFRYFFLFVLCSNAHECELSTTIVTWRHFVPFSVFFPQNWTVKDEEINEEKNVQRASKLEMNWKYSVFYVLIFLCFLFRYFACPQNTIPFHFRDESEWKWWRWRWWQRFDQKSASSESENEITHSFK